MKAQEFGSAQHQARCATLEEDSVSNFRNLCANRGYSYTKSNPRMDKFEHIDATIRKGDVSYAVDIKGAKRYSDQGLLLVELVNVIGQRGWLFGRADLIAFALADRFMFIPRNALYQFLKNKMGLTVLVQYGFKVIPSKGCCVKSLPCDAPNWYHREDRQKEMITYVRMEEIKHLEIQI